MKTIEERADKYIDNNFTRIAEEMPICEGMKTLYVESATEQKAIDEAEYRNELLRKEEEFEAALAAQRKMLIDKACEWLGNVSWIDDFKKAMEDEK